MSTVRADPTGDELAVVAARLAGAARPEDVFGALTGGPAKQLSRLRHHYRRLAVAVHPDRNGNAPLAHQAFVALQRLYATAVEEIEHGRYGRPPASPDPVIIATRRHSYAVGDLLAEGDLASLYACRIDGSLSTGAGLLKIAHDPRDNDLLENEVRTLRDLLAPVDGEPVPAYLPRLLESFRYRDSLGVDRHVNAFLPVSAERGSLLAAEWFSLAEVRRAYPAGVDARQMAWIWRRLLIALGHAHDRDVVHGAVLPSHVLVHPDAHGLLLVDWCASVRRSGTGVTRIPALSTEYERWYPPSVLVGVPPTPAVDLEMGLRCMVSLLGGDPLTGALPAAVPGPLRAHLQGTLATVHRTTAWRLYQDFSGLLATLWGQRKFVPFSMPARQWDGPAR